MNPIKDKTDLSGLLGEKLSVNKVNGKVVVTNRPKRKVIADPTAAQASWKQKFIEAAKWAKYQMTLPDVKELYKAGITDKKKSAFLVAVTDYVTSPTVLSINTSTYKGAVGDAISAKATDDFGVAEVLFTVIDSTGKVLEQGSGKQNVANIFEWSYAATIANPTVTGTKITVTAIDRPGNKTSLDSMLS